MAEPVLLTKEGIEKLKQELEETEKELKGIAKELEKALEYGDLSENAEYLEAKEKQRIVSTRAQELKGLLRNAQLISEAEGKKKKGTVVEVGSTISLRNLTENDPTETFTIVGTMEADPFAGKISNESPVGQAVLGQKKGDIVKVAVPAGEHEYEIMEVK
ncbi:transcription elongation factor GreA [Candidatus Peregrinibacteria bacterium CG08_land_8_20_14_0_20_41_10]|nr:MAG: transcription elongation factor GreA [Candidatus Peregrinibacteria bacterium CG08_land_8_20_14_0_20_41_10]